MVRIGNLELVDIIIEINMWESFKDFINHLLSPHCHECDLNKECLNCLKFIQLLDQEKSEKRKLLDTLISLLSEPVEDKVETPAPIKPALVPWRIKKELLEQEDRKKAQILKEQTEELEKELNIKSNEQV